MEAILPGASGAGPVAPLGTMLRAEYAASRAMAGFPGASRVRDGGVTFEQAEVIQMPIRNDECQKYLTAILLYFGSRKRFARQ